ncbi:2,4'-dihydroxyacetophenone dioxygenase family protein [Pseudomonas sp. 22526]|uniref:2,4'-dihydroxyacetophenone dioxygenase family protein n=1 Tax=Pseudomonas sp. 22526 TaxID=3453937 RepID=UPI003F84C931
MNDSNSPVLELLAALQSQGVITREGAREAILLNEDDLPWVTLPDGSLLQVLQVDLNQNLWVVRNRLKPGFSIDTHYHTGPVFAITLSGEWFYKEYPDKINKAGSYLFEPAHSVHTLVVDADAKEDAVVWFAVFGSNVNINEKGDVTSVLDARSLLMIYRLLCQAQGENCDKVIVLGE